MHVRVLCGNTHALLIHRPFRAGATARPGGPHTVGGPQGLHHGLPKVLRSAGTGTGTGTSHAQLAAQRGQGAPATGGSG